MREKIITLGRQVGAKVGFVKAREFPELLPILSKEHTPMVCDNLQERINPFLLLPCAKTIIVCLFPYSGTEGNLARYAQNEDYHITVPKKLKQISKPLSDNGYEVKCFCDTSPLCERYLAYLAGLGFFGRNKMLINPELGSFTNIGCILTDCEFEESKPIEKDCGDCDLCIKNCPGGAIGNAYNPNRCSSYISQKKGELNADEEKILKKSGYAWGCDRCQTVCPYNKLENKPVRCNNLFSDMATSNRDFKKKYGDMAFSWRGFDVIKRNLEIIGEDGK